MHRTARTVIVGTVAAMVCVAVAIIAPKNTHPIILVLMGNIVGIASVYSVYVLNRRCNANK